MMLRLVKWSFILAVLIFFVNVTWRLLTPLLPARRVVTYAAAGILPPAASVPPAPAPAPGQAAGAGGAARPAPLEEVNPANVSVVEQEALRTLTSDVGRFYARALELKKEGDRDYLVAVLEWTGAVGDPGTFWLALSAQYTSLVVGGTELQPVRIEGAADLDATLKRLIAGRVSVGDALRTIGLDAAARQVPGVTSGVRLFFPKPPHLAAPTAAWAQLRLTAWTNDSLAASRSGWEAYRSISDLVLDAAWGKQSAVTQPLGEKVAIRGRLWIPPAAAPAPAARG